MTKPALIERGPISPLQNTKHQGACSKARPLRYDRAMKNHAVVIAGAGPTGMMLCAELKLADVDVAIVEPSTTKDREGGSRAGGLHARTIEVFDTRGIADRF